MRIEAVKLVAVGTMMAEIEAGARIAAPTAAEPDDVDDADTELDATHYWTTVHRNSVARPAGASPPFSLCDTGSGTSLGGGRCLGVGRGSR